MRDPLDMPRPARRRKFDRMLLWGVFWFALFVAVEIMVHL